MLGVKIQISAFHEKLGFYEQAINILEQVRTDCLKWNEYYGDKPENAERRTRLLAKAIQMSMKLGEYYSHGSIQNPGAAEEKMVWAVTAILMEQRRQKEAEISPNELKGWISQGETGAALEGITFLKLSLSNPLPNLPKSPNPHLQIVLLLPFRQQTSTNRH